MVKQFVDWVEQASHMISHSYREILMNEVRPLPKDKYGHVSKISNCVLYETQPGLHVATRKIFPFVAVRKPPKHSKGFEIVNTSDTLKDVMHEPVFQARDCRVTTEKDDRAVQLRW